MCAYIYIYIYSCSTGPWPYPDLLGHGKKSLMQSYPWPASTFCIVVASNSQRHDWGLAMGSGVKGSQKQLCPCDCRVIICLWISFSFAMDGPYHPISLCGCRGRSASSKSYQAKRRRVCTPTTISQAPSKYGRISRSSIKASANWNVAWFTSLHLDYLVWGYLWWDMSPFPFQINTILAAEVVAAMPMNKNLELHALPFQVAKENAPK